MSGIPSIPIRIWADIACPWCWIGHRRLLRALEARPELEAQLAWEPYQLQPGLPSEGIAWSRMLEERFGGSEPARFLLGHVTELGAREGIRFRFDLMSRAPNTARAHALILAAREHEAEWRMAERLFEAHFGEGADLSDVGTLGTLAREVGLPGPLVARALESDEFGRAVAASQEEAAALGAQGVPFFRIGGSLALTGAQPPEVFDRSLRSVLQSRSSGGGDLDTEDPAWDGGDPDHLRLLDD